MHYQEFVPPPYLADIVRYYWVLEDFGDSSDIFSFRVLADGYPGFILCYKNQFSWNSGELETQWIPKCFFFGVLQKYRGMNVSGNFGILGASFFSQNFHHLMNIPASELANRSVDVEDLFGSKGIRLKNRLQGVSQHNSRIKLVNQFLSDIRHEERDNTQLVQLAIRQIFSKGGNEPISKLIKSIAMSRRQFERKFKEYIGISPKKYSRIIRFQRTLRQTQICSSKRLSELAFECGYSDQSHFIREFKAFAGVNPRLFFKHADEVAENFVHIR